ncbi:MAG: KEOPS complex kinase/ATPase Bud32 [Candidatus Pacearchaeota archaeon]|jgi:Kae1-associated kinase Bud32
MIKKISQGAEAFITLNNNQVIKNRIKKSYRINEIDNKLIKSRTRSEAKIIEKLNGIIPVPKIIKTNNEDEIIMEYLEGKKLSESLEKLDYLRIAKSLGNSIGKMHDKDIIHGDLTTSNMIEKNNLVYLIDFGLAYHSKKIEDKAVDLHLLKQALDAKHFTINKEFFNILLDSYSSKDKVEIIKRIKTIESRGRYKDKH